MPTTAELFDGLRSEIALVAIFKSGAGFHNDRRHTKEKKKEWRKEDWN